MTTDKIIFNTPIGFEYSFIPEIDDDYYYVSKTLQKRLMGRYKNVYAYNDFGAIEVNSPVYKDWYKTLKFYQFMCQKAEDMGLKTHSKTECGGGLHVHIDLPKGNIVPSAEIC